MEHMPTDDPDLAKGKGEDTRRKKGERRVVMIINYQIVGMLVKDREILKLMAERDYLMKRAQEEALTFNERTLGVRNDCI